MTLYDVLLRNGRLDVVCVMPSCGAHTELEAKQLVTRRGPEAALSRIAEALVCAACGRGPVVVGCSAASDFEAVQRLPGP